MTDLFYFAPQTGCEAMAMSDSHEGSGADICCKGCRGDRVRGLQQVDQWNTFYNRHSGVVERAIARSYLFIILRLKLPLCSYGMIIWSRSRRVMRASYPRNAA